MVTIPSSDEAGVCELTNVIPRRRDDYYARSGAAATIRCESNTTLTIVIGVLSEGWVSLPR